MERVLRAIEKLSDRVESLEQGQRRGAQNPGSRGVARNQVESRQMNEDLRAENRALKEELNNERRRMAEMARHMERLQATNHEMGKRQGDRQQHAERMVVELEARLAEMQSRMTDTLRRTDAIKDENRRAVLERERAVQNLKSGMANRERQLEQMRNQERELQLLIQRTRDESVDRRSQMDALRERAVTMEKRLQKSEETIDRQASIIADLKAALKQARKK